MTTSPAPAPAPSNPSSGRPRVVIVGTGAGGAVVGALLAEAGHDVLFIEEGSYFGTSSFNPYVTESVPRLYRDASATVIAGIPPIPYIEGRCVGGSTTINGGMTWRAPGKVMAADVVKVKSAKTVQGSSATVTVNGGKVKIDNANVIKTDIAASNGVIHVIDAVILPKM